MKKLTFFVVAICILVPGLGHAKSDNSIVINEVMWMGSTLSSSDEWIELRNITDEDIDISGWKICGVGGEDDEIKLAPGSVIQDKGFFVIANYSSSSASTILKNDADYITSALSIKNEDTQIILKNSDDIIIDVVGSGISRFTAGDNNMKWSMERRELLQGGQFSSDWYTATENKGFKEGVTDLGTPGNENSHDSSRHFIPLDDAKKSQREAMVKGQVTVLPNTLFDDRIYILSQDAGIRIYLQSGVWPILTLGQIVEVRGRIQTYYGETELIVADPSDITTGDETRGLEPIKIKIAKAEKYIGALTIIEGKIARTSGDIFYIKDDTGEIKVFVKDGLGINLPDKEIDNKAAIQGIVSIWNGALRLLPRSTKDIDITKTEKANVVPLDLSIKDARLQSIGTLVTVQGIVSVIPGVLGKTLFYVQDDYAGIQIYSWYKDFPILRLGDLIRVTGEVSKSSGEVRIKIKSSLDIQIVQKKNVPMPKSVSISSLFLFKGMLVRIRGRVIKTSGDTFYVEDATGAIKINIKKETAIKKPRLHKKDIVEIIGIVSETQAGLRILPRYQSDFNLVWTKPAKGKVLKASTFKKINISKPHIVLEAQKVSAQSNLIYFAYGVVALMASSLILLKNVRLEQ